MAKTIEQVYRVGIYCRLSKDDGTDNESASIATQKSILTEYVKKQGWHLTKTYVTTVILARISKDRIFRTWLKTLKTG